MKRSDSDDSPLVRGGHVPKPTRPPGLVPAPRVVFRTRRKDLSHENRVKRLDGTENLVLWQAFADRFIKSSDGLDTDTASYLLNRGFDADKAALYGLPNDDVDAYLSDLQVMLLPQANGRDRSIIENRQLFRQVFHGLLPFVPLIAVLRRGQVVGGNPPGELPAGGRYWVLPTVHGAGLPMYIDVEASQLVSPSHVVAFSNVWDCLQETGQDALVVRCPPASQPLDRVRVLVVRDPRNAVPSVVGAVVTLYPGAALPFDTLAAGAMSANVDIASGTLESACRLAGGAPERVEKMPGDDEPLIGRPVPHWWEIQLQVTNALLRLPMFSVLQMDFSVGGASPLLIDATARVDAAEFQVHGPMMGSALCRRLLREYGI